jgi:uncharacterized protein
MSQVLELLSLQAIDDELASYRAANADVERRLLGDDELIEARRVLLERETVLEAARREQRRAEAEVEDISDRIAREETRLYDGSIKNPKELTSLQHEVETQKAMRSRFEDTLIQALDNAEAANREHREAAKAVTALEARWHTAQDALRHEARRLQDLITRGEAKREIQKPNVTPRALHLYEDLRKRKGGMAVSRLNGSTCSGCRIAIPDALRRKAMAPMDLAQCPNCERILSIG